VDPTPGISLEGVADRTDSSLVAQRAVASADGSQPGLVARLTGGDRQRWLGALGITLVVLLPLIVTAAVLAGDQWRPVLDLAQTEMRVRDVWSSDPPLTGLAGRIGTFGSGGSHPGPLSFWALWPLYQLFGASSWALQAAALGLNAIAITLALWLAYRRGGIPVLLGVAAALALLTRAYGPSLLSEPWNPYMPMMWWFAFMIAVWSVLCDDAPALPIVVFAGSFCMQTHVSYVVLIGGLGVFALGVFAYRWYRERGSSEHGRTTRWGLIAVGLAVVLWTPPVIDELVHSPGNLSILWDHFRHPPDPPIGLGTGLEEFLVQLNPWALVTRLLVVAGETREISGSVVPGILMLGVWAAAAFTAWRLRAQVLTRLNVVVGVALLLGVISASRINGFVWFYLLLWARGIATLMLVTIGWAAALVIGRRIGTAHRAQAARAGRGALIATAVALSALFVVDAARVDIPAERLSDGLGAITGPTADALADRPDDAPYLVTWLPDPLWIGAQGYGLLNELERRGFDVRADQIHRVGATPHRVMPPDDATLEVHVAIGPEIERWRAKPAFEEIAYVDQRTASERREFEELRAEVIAQLAPIDDELVEIVNGNLFVLTFDERVPQAAKDRIQRMGEIGLPMAVFLGPPVTG
jgi:hypothetical protein